MVHYLFTFVFSHVYFTMQINLMGQLHLLSSTVTTLAVPSPSLLATVARMSLMVIILLAILS
jgi:hypothetical protein